tara:strand:- start:1032 stop:2036 length:1005 start_codon:yes stop_codon:yes gene_type:complete
LTIKFTTFEHYKSTAGKPHAVDVSTFIHGMVKPVTTAAQDKRAVSLWSPTMFNGPRSKENAQELSCVVYDVDDGVTPMTVWLKFAASYNVIVHTSYSHKPEHHKFRIILPLAQPIPAADWNRAHLAALELWSQVVGKRTPSKADLKRAAKLYNSFSGSKSGYRINQPDDPRTKAFTDFWVDIAGTPMPDMSALTDRARMYYRFAVPASESPQGYPLHPVNYHFADAWDRGQTMTLDYSHIKLPEPPPRPVFEPGRKYAQEEILLNTDMRMKIANMANATIKDNVARYITCPRCGRDTVYFFIDLYQHAGAMLKGAKCNHEGNSCGWFGSLKELA